MGDEKEWQRLPCEKGWTGSRTGKHKTQDPGLLPYMSDRAPDINDPAGGATHDRNADILGKNRRNDLSLYGHFGPRRRGPIAKKDIIYPSELARRHVSGACVFEV